MAAAVACGSSDDSSLYGGGQTSGGDDSGAATGSSAGGADAAPGGGGPGGGGGAGGVSGGTSSGAGNGLVPDASGPDPDASMGVAGQIGVDASRSSDHDAALQRDASPLRQDGGGSTSGSILCAGLACVIAGVPTNMCCVAPPLSIFPTTCLPTFPGCVNGGAIPVTCDDASDCSGSQVCCGKITAGAGTGCVDVCGADGDSVQLCRTSSECVGGGTCRPVDGFPEYGSCQ